MLVERLEGTNVAPKVHRNCRILQAALESVELDTARVSSTGYRPKKKRYMEVKGQKPLSEEELELLEQLDFPFFENQARMAWNSMYTEVVRFPLLPQGNHVRNWYAQDDQLAL